MESLSVIFEIMMIVLFGASWPFNIARAYKSKTAKGTSIVFLFLIEIGYAAGILHKILESMTVGAGFWTGLRITAFCFYIVNFCMLAVAIIIYFRNKRIDADKAKVKE